MKDFDSIKNIWQQAETNEVTQKITLAKSTKTNKLKLQRNQIVGAVLLFFTAILIASMAIWGDFGFKHWYTYLGMSLICMICLVQAAILYFTYQKIKAIDDTAAPAKHLQQWENYYQFRQNQTKWNMPVYYLFLNLAMGIYMIEIFNGRPILNVSIFIAIYLAWMIFAYFYLGKKEMKKEQRRLNEILESLRSVGGQLEEEK